MNESDVLGQVRDWLRIHGYFVCRIQQGLGAHKGISDLIVVGHGRTAFIEIKTDKGKLSPHQESFRANVESGGGTYIVARCIEDVATLIEKEGSVG